MAEPVQPVEPISDATFEPLKPETKIPAQLDTSNLVSYDGAQLSPTRSNDSTLTGAESPHSPQISDDTAQLVDAPAGQQGIRWVPLRVPFRRRMQTLSILWFELAAGLFLSVFWFLCAVPLFWPIIVPYLLYLAFAEVPHDGPPRNWLSPFIRSPKFWSNYTSYFPMHLHRSVELSPEHNYLFGYHPHGIIGHGAWGNLVTKTTGWNELFPGISNTVLTLETNFRIPFYREYLIGMGVGSVSRKSCEGLLGGVEGEVSQSDIDASVKEVKPKLFGRWRGRNSDKPSGITPKEFKPNKAMKRGQGITIVIGGAQESLLAFPGNMQLVLRKRKGFVRVAIRTGAHLVPIISFGENELYDQIVPEKTSLIYKFQILVKKTLGFTIPLFHARGVFNYDVGFLAYRRPVHTIVGRPIPVVQDPHPSDKVVDEIHQRYMDELQRLWDDHKEQFAFIWEGEMEFL